MSKDDSDELDCAVCFRRPAIFIDIRWNYGFVIAWRWRQRRVSVCKEHGEEQAKKFLLRTRLLGWLSLGSAETNRETIRMDRAALEGLASLPPASGDPHPPEVRCIECHRGPAIEIRVRYFQRLQLHWRTPLVCREHGETFANEYLLQALHSSDPISWLLNRSAIRQNRAALVALKGLTPPVDNVGRD